MVNHPQANPLVEMRRPWGMTYVENSDLSKGATGPGEVEDVEEVIGEGDNLYLDEWLNFRDASCI
eukprot:CAMPEP_0197490896 /NCGR_PEP_ID=MMETSP1311-20131121/5319_1 /TAXON_ID=464262 /ORGANISM="Genus nov. species nov., Strain RCC856" /LENGTH=64 /DNA_ID=CAMNT_0043035475 /DNA_START=57 /DNA_END=251 /DNA_ORIENTATION=+